MIVPLALPGVFTTAIIAFFIAWNDFVYGISLTSTSAARPVPAAPGITSVCVTHDQTEAMTVGDRVAVLKKGRLQQVASPRELYQQPANLVVAGFIGSPSMDFLPSREEGGHLRPS